MEKYLLVTGIRDLQVREKEGYRFIAIITPHEWLVEWEEEWEDIEELPPIKGKIRDDVYYDIHKARIGEDPIVKVTKTPKHGKSTDKSTS